MRIVKTGLHGSCTPLHDCRVADGPVERARRLLDSQREYYELRAPDYMDVRRPSDRKSRGLLSSSEVRHLLDSLDIQGDVLELAGGSGAFTKELVGRAVSLTVLDSSPTMLDLNRSVVNDPAVEYLCADVFTWTPPRQWDFIFFGFWLSHVPATHFANFWDTVGRALRPTGRCAFVDEDHRGIRNELVVVDDAVPSATRTLSDGRSFEIVKLFWEPADLERLLTAIGWQASVRSFGEAHLIGEARRSPDDAARP
jgi:SAM-dependent methyltransferase